MGNDELANITNKFWAYAIDAPCFEAAMNSGALVLCRGAMEGGMSLIRGSRSAEEGREDAIEYLLCCQIKRNQK